MKKILIPMLLVLLAVGCRGREDGRADALQCEACYHLGGNTELRLMGDGNLSQLELWYGGELQELVGTTNTEYVRNEAGEIALDTVHLDGDGTQYIVRTADRSSTYGAEVWYVVCPYRPGDPDGPWSIVKVQSDKPWEADLTPLVQ